MQNIILVSYGHFELDFLKRIAIVVTNEFHYPVTIKEGKLELGMFYDPNRRQYDGNKILKVVDSEYHFNAIKILGLFNIDLFIPILTFIFGQAYLKGFTGIASVYRLKNERYGLPSDENLLLERSIKEVIHELGHTFGLKHCQNPVCVMRSSTYVEDLDQKKDTFCSVCRSIINSK